MLRHINPHFARLLNLAGLVGVLALAAESRAQGMRDLIEAALDQKVTTRIEIAEKPIRAALTDLEKPTGLHFEVDPRAIEWMPYGEQTRVAVTIENISARAALTRIFDGLGLAMHVADNAVVVEPAPVLERLGRRLTVDEVALLQKLASEPWAKVAGPTLPIDFRLPPEDKGVEQFDRAMREGKEAPALGQLEAVVSGMGWLWVPSGKGLVIYSQADDIQRRLDQPIDAHYVRVNLDELLLDLGKRANVTVHFEPGALQRVDAKDRKVDLIQRDTTVRQILELIVGRTGLVYDVQPSGIVIATPPPATQPAAGGDGGRVVAIVRVPVGTDGTTVDFLIRENELPPEIKALKERKMPQIIELLKKQADKP